MNLNSAPCTICNRHMLRDDNIMILSLKSKQMFLNKKFANTCIQKKGTRFSKIPLTTLNFVQSFMRNWCCRHLGQLHKISQINCEQYLDSPNYPKAITCSLQTSCEHYLDSPNNQKKKQSMVIRKQIVNIILTRQTIKRTP